MNIKNEHTCKLAKELAAITGKSITATIEDALSEKLAKLRAQNNKKAQTQELLDIGKRCAGHIKGNPSSTEHGDFLYDENGLPK